MIKIRIVKLPPEAMDLAKKIESTIADMIAKTVKSMVGVDNNLENINITVYEELIKDKENRLVEKMAKKILQNIEKT